MKAMFEKTEEASMGAFELNNAGNHLTTWTKGRVLLLGDAAHAMCNRLGAGGCTGIEDAHQAAELIEFCTRDQGGESDAAIQEAFKLTTRKRRFRGLKVQEQSMLVAQMSVLMADSCMS